jgi:hypothetical protein
MRFSLRFAAPTPSFVIGRTSAGKMDGVRFIGAQPYGAFDARLKEVPQGRPKASLLE